MPPDPPAPTKERFCWNCGRSMGRIESRYYERTDTCGAIECSRAERDMHREEREEAHRDLDEQRGW